MMNRASELHLSILGYNEDDRWVAHALEMDILAYGADFDDACSQLEGLVMTQLRFAGEKKDLSLLWHPAPRKFFNRYIAAVLDSRSSEPGLQTRSMSIPPAHIIPTAPNGSCL